MIISTVSLKGGVGKTTIAVNLSVYFAMQGYSVLIVDADENQNAVKWSGLRGNAKVDITAVGLTNPAALRNNIENLAIARDIIIIDGTPALNEIANTIMLISDVSIFPIQASPLDLWAFNDKFLPRFNDVKVIRPGLLGLILLNNVDSRTNLSDEIIEAVESYEIPVLTNFISDRVIYRDSIAYGLSVLEIDGKKANQKAIEEVNNLGQEITKLIQNGQDK